MSRAATNPEDLAQSVVFYLKVFQAPPHEREYVFHRARRWRFDFAWPWLKVAVEVDGGTRGAAVICHQCGCRVRARTKSGAVGRELRIGGRHTRPEGFRNDAEKRNAAMMAGWRVFHLTSDMLADDPNVVAPIAQLLRQLSEDAGSL